ncbi:hypothetical protein ABMA28_012791 [Loxostege sticticalis]|uniref:Regulatory protein zeste n=1 Tax=Loxostege sticticalis TaxID=481309 RepID=A0ABD0S4R6_LOXSC
MEEDKYIWQRPSPAQVECIVEFFEKNPALNKGYIKTESQRDIRQKAWQKLAFRLNNMEGCTKNFQQWLRYWTDKKVSVKKKLSLVTRCQITCDSKGHLVVDPLGNFTNLERRIINIMGGERLVKAARSANKIRESQKILKEAVPTVKEDLPQQVSAEQDHSYLNLNENEGVQDVEEPAEYINDTQEVPIQETTTDAPLASPEPASPAAPSGSDTPEDTARRPAPSTRNRHRPRHKQSSFARLTERFLRLKEERLEVDRRNSRLLENLLKHEVERDKLLAQALQASAEGLRALAEAMRNINNHITYLHFTFFTSHKT